MANKRRLEQTIEQLLADPRHGGHPMQQALSELYDEYRDTLRQIERIAHISDRYQHVSREQTQSLSERYQKQLRQMARMARISDRYQLMMRDMNEVLKDVSNKDALTGIANRHLLMERLKAESARAERLRHPLTLVIADVDRFKTINDTYGHDIGDRVLVKIAQVFANGVRNYDLCGRWGGEEFLLILPEIIASDAFALVERVRCALTELKLCHGDREIALSASFGIAERHAGEAFSATIKRADQALFAAKHGGRNRCEVAA